MNKEEKEAIEYLRKYTQWETHGERSLETDILTLLNLIQKQEAIIDKMAEKLEEKSRWMTKGKWKEYFKKEVEKE